MRATMGPELLLLLAVLIVVLVWRGPSNLPRLGEALGKAVKGAKDAMPHDKDHADDADDPGPRATP